MVKKGAGEKALPSEMLQRIVAKTDGVPLFDEELTKAVIESELYAGARHASPLSPWAIPPTMHDTLIARLARLAPIREVRSWPESCHTRTVWLWPCTTRPGSINTAVRGRPPKSEQRKLLRFLTSKGFRFWEHGELCIEAGRWVRVYYLWRPNLSDEADNHLIELAIAGSAEYLLTYNVRDFANPELRLPHLKIRTPPQFLREVREDVNLNDPYTRRKT